MTRRVKPLTTSQLCRAAGVSRITIQQMVRSGLLRPEQAKLEGRLHNLFPAEQVAALIELRRHHSPRNGIGPVRHPDGVESVRSGGRTEAGKAS